MKPVNINNETLRNATDVDEVVRIKIDKILARIKPEHKVDFLDFVLEGTITPGFREYYENDTEARDASDMALQLMSESFQMVADTLRP